MRPRAAAPVAWILSVLVPIACLLAACTQHAADAPQAGDSLLPQLAPRQDQVQRLQLRGAGGKPLVSLQRVGDEWLLEQRAGWRGDGARIGQYLALLAQARRVEAKTD